MSHSNRPQEAKSQMGHSASSPHERHEDDIYDYEYHLLNARSVIARSTKISIRDKQLIILNIGNRTPGVISLHRNRAFVIKLSTLTKVLLIALVLSFVPAGFLSINAKAQSTAPVPNFSATLSNVATV